MREFTDNEIYLMGQVLHIFDLFDQEFSRHRGTVALEHRTDGPNPYHCVTESGVYLEYYYGSPSMLWTPWGKWHIHGGLATFPGDGYEEAEAAFMSSLTLRVHQPMTRSVLGDHGPTYQLFAVGDDPLPTPGEVAGYTSLAQVPDEGRWKRLVLAAQARSTRGQQLGNLDPTRFQHLCS